MADMTIAGLARQCGVGVETVRFYQRRGLLETPSRGIGGAAAGGGVRRYGEQDVRRLRFVRSAQAAGFSLEDIVQLLRLDVVNDRPRVREMAARRVAVLDAQIAQLQAARSALARLVHDCGNADAGPCPILQAFEG